MFWSLDSMDEQTFGQLIASFRRRRGLNQADVAPLLARFAVRFPPQLSLLEGGSWQTRPDRGLIQEFARLYTLSPREESFLLRQADILPSATEQQSILMRFGAILLDFSSPACVLNMHWQLVAWNDAFAGLYDGGEYLRSGTSRFMGPDRSLQAASRTPNLTLGSNNKASQEGDNRPNGPIASSPLESDRLRGVRLDDILVLKENLSIFALLFSRTSKLRSDLRPRRVEQTCPVLADSIVAHQLTHVQSVLVPLRGATLDT